MTKIVVLALPGTGYNEGVADPITADFLSRFSSQYETRVISYPASFGGLEPSFEVSRAAGTHAVYAELDAIGPETPVVLVGYSQGAVIMGDLARDLGIIKLSGDIPYNIVAVGLIADGYRPAGVGLVPPGQTAVAEGYGIAGQRLIPTLHWPVYWVSAWGDPIASLPAGNPLRSVADLVGWFTLRSPADVVNWGARMLDAVVSGRLQDWWAPWKWSGWAGALAFARGYLFDGRHTADYIIHDFTRTLASKIQSDLADVEE